MVWLVASTGEESACYKHSTEDVFAYRDAYVLCTGYVGKSNF
jgi:hypothetical protein